MKSIFLFAVFATISSCSAFYLHPSTLPCIQSKHGRVAPFRNPSPRLARSDCHDDALQKSQPHHLDRRSVFSILGLIPMTILTSSTPLPAKAAESNKGKVVILGGAGWVGSHVAKLLDQKGYQVLSISRSTPQVQIKRTESILGTTLPNVEYLSLDASTVSQEELATLMKDASAVISCVGAAPGSPNQKDGNGRVNVRIADAAKSAGVPKFVYIGVASSLANSPAKFLIGDYFQGKAEAEKSVVRDFGDESSLIIKPAIVAGGTPGEMRPPGPPGVKPVDVEVLAKVVAAGVVGGLKGRIDGNDDIFALGN